jgi:peptide/nickel transport system permease protein
VAVPFAVAVLVGILGPFLVPFDPERVVADASTAPGAAHWFGTDATGMDVFSRVVAATRVNLVMALSVTLSTTVVGVLLGLVVGMSESAGGVRGLLGRGVNRVIDLSDAIPALVVGVVVAGLFGPSVLTLSIALSFILLPNQIRLTRSEVLRVRHDAYLDAARMAGLSEAKVVVRHVLPNSCRPALENSSHVFGVSIIVAASLGFLGVGLAPPTAEWGSMISAGVSDIMLGRWWSALFPAAALTLTVASVAACSGALTRLTRGHSR